jgi:VanZ family protein
MMRKLLKDSNFYFFVAVTVILVLFISSSQTYEQQSQIGLLSRLLKNEPLKDWLSGISFSYAGSEVSIAAKGYFSFVEFFIRKGAHFFTYFVLSGSLFFVLVYRRVPLWLAAFFAWLAATGYAGIDEYHQMLTGGRTPLFQDVMLDSAGALTAVLISWLCCLWRQKKRKR